MIRGVKGSVGCVSAMGDGYAEGIIGARGLDWCLNGNERRREEEEGERSAFAVLILLSSFIGCSALTAADFLTKASKK